MVSAVMLAWVPAGVGAGLARPVRARLRDCREASGAGLSLSAGWSRGSQGRGLASLSCPQLFRDDGKLCILKEKFWLLLGK